MDTITLRPSQGNQPEWKTQDYHGKGIHVSTALRVNRNKGISGHGQQWDFKVRVTDQGTGPTAHELAWAESDRGYFYSTQAITEALGFVRARELVEA